MADPQTETLSIYQKGDREAIFYRFDEEFELAEGLRLTLKDKLR